MIHYLLANFEMEYHLYAPETYGLNSWGNGYAQDYIELNDSNKWIFHSWSAGGFEEEDTITDVEVPVVLETTSLKRIIRYLKNHNATVEQIKDIVAQAKQIILDYVAIEEWTRNVG